MLVVILSGDGGWREIDSELGDYFAKQGYPVVGIDSLKYYWKARTPEVAAADLVRVLRDRMSRYRSEKVMLVGYSFGADVASFLANRVPDDLRAKLWRVGLIGPSTDGDFEIHGAGLIGARDDNRLDNVAEVIAAQAKGIPLLCVEGKEDTEAICDVVAKQGVPMRSMPGGHHLLGRYQALGEVLLSELPALPAAAR